MNTEDELSDEALKWITPIMMRGIRAVCEAVAGLIDGGNKSAVVIAALGAEFTNEEQVIYYCTEFDNQCNMSGLCNFFTDSISLSYYEVIAALGVIGAEDMIDDLKRCKHVIFGDQEVPVHDEDLLDDFTHPDDPDREVVISSQLDAIDKDSFKRLEGFEKRLYHYVLSCASKGLLKNQTG
jgi:hypothetical protein